MDAAELQSKTTIAAALIMTHAVETPAMPKDRAAVDQAALRLRELTDYVYHVLTAEQP